MVGQVRRDPFAHSSPPLPATRPMASGERGEGAPPSVAISYYGLKRPDMASARALRRGTPGSVHAIPLGVPGAPIPTAP